MAKLRSKLGAILKERGISAAQLSMAINHRRSTINDLINKEDLDNNRIAGSLIANVCAYLKITPNDLFEVEYTDDYYKAAFLALKNTISLDSLNYYFSALLKKSEANIYTNLKLYGNGEIGYSMESSSDITDDEDDDPHLILLETHPNELRKMNIEDLRIDVFKKLKAMSLNYIDTNEYSDSLLIYSSEGIEHWVNQKIEEMEDKSSIRILKWENDFEHSNLFIIDWYADETTIANSNLYLKKALGSFRDFDATFFESMNIFICFSITEENLIVLRSMKRLYNFVYHIFMHQKDAHNLMGSVDINSYLKGYNVVYLDK